MAGAVIYILSVYQAELTLFFSRLILSCAVGLALAAFIQSRLRSGAPRFFPLWLTTSTLVLLYLYNTLGVREMTIALLSSVMEALALPIILLVLFLIFRPHRHR